MLYVLATHRSCSEETGASCSSLTLLCVCLTKHVEGCRCLLCRLHQIEWTRCFRHIYQKNQITDSFLALVWKSSAIAFHFVTFRFDEKKTFYRHRIRQQCLSAYTKYDNRSEFVSSSFAVFLFRSKHKKEKTIGMDKNSQMRSFRLFRQCSGTTSRVHKEKAASLYM